VKGDTMEEYKYSIDKIGGVILFNSDKSLYLQGDDARIFIEDIEETEQVWDTGTDMCRDILKNNFVNLEGHISYIISHYFF
jgi:hypothetical protein